MRLSITLLLAAMAAAACGQAHVTPSPSGQPSPTPRSSVDETPGSSATASPSPSPGLEVVDGKLGGGWLVRQVLVASKIRPPLDDAAFQDRTFVVTPTCPEEPCDAISVLVHPVNRWSVLEQIDLIRTGMRYEGSPVDVGVGACLTSSGAPLEGAASITKRTSVWLERVRRQGTAVSSVRLGGRIEFTAEPSQAGSAAGCEGWVATYSLSGRPVRLVARVEPNPSPRTGTSTAGLVALPKLSVKAITGATISYFGVSGDTSGELHDSIEDGGLRVCGAIRYEWYRGDRSPAGCAATRLLDGFIGFEASSSTGACRAFADTSKAHTTVHIPRWISPDRVPAWLLEWWRGEVARIRDHEAQHVAIFRTMVAKLPGLIDGVGCAQVGAIIDRWAQQVNAAQEAFDRAEYG